MKKLCLSIVACCLWVVNPVAAQDFEATALAKKIWLGQAVGSADAFVIHADDGQDTPIPSKVKILSTEPQSQLEQWTGRLIERLDGFDVTQEGASNHSSKFAKQKIQLAKKGFFEIVFDGGFDDANIAHYVLNTSIKRSFPIVAYDETVLIQRLDFSNRGLSRPMSSAEAEQLSQTRAQMQRVLADQECMTEPAYLDQAKQLWSADVAHSNLSLRLSRYDNAGCAGHLEHVYVLDVLREHGVVYTQYYTHYFGAI